MVDVLCLSPRLHPLTLSSLGSLPLGWELWTPPFAICHCDMFPVGSVFQATLFPADICSGAAEERGQSSAAAYSQLPAAAPRVLRGLCSAAAPPSYLLVPLR